MIVSMTKVRIMGPRPRLHETLVVLQDVGLVHLADPCGSKGLTPVRLEGKQAAERLHLRRILAAVEVTLTGLEGFGGAGLAPTGVAPTRPALARWARLARRLEPEVAELRERLADLQEERALILKYRPFLDAFGALLRDEGRWTNAAAYHVVLRREDAGVLTRLDEALRAVLGEEFELRSQPLSTGELAVLIFVTARVAGRVERIMGEVRLQEIPVPASFGGGSLADAAPLMFSRLDVIPAELDTTRAQLASLAEAHRAELEAARRALRDRVEELDALPLSCVTTHAFVIDGWVPARERPTLEGELLRRFGTEVVADELPAEDWDLEEAPVVLRNRRVVQPFEAVLRLLPPPRYGSIDPVLYVALFFPLFFGLMLGDVGYGAILAGLAWLLHRRSRPGTLLRQVSEIAGICAGSSVLFGVLFGEVFGDLGRRVWGLRPLVFDREKEMVTFLAVAVGIGFVHVLIGLVLGVLTARRHEPRLAVSRGLTAGMLVLLAVVLGAAAGVLPEAIVLPGAIVLGLGLPVLVFCEGVAAPVEFLSTVGNVLSYARLMALGTASVMLALVANELAGKVGNLALGVLIGVLFHAVNLALGLFSPTIHALRLHYVEFFGKFYDPGGHAYRPFTHWHPDVKQST